MKVGAQAGGGGDLASVQGSEQAGGDLGTEARKCILL